MRTISSFVCRFGSNRRADDNVDVALARGGGGGGGILREEADISGEEGKDILKAEITLSVQKELAQLGYYQGPLDGVTGPETEAAVRKFQSVDKLPVTGQIDRATLKALSVS